MNDPYVYKGTSILINSLNIKDEEQLDKAESDFAIIAIEKLRKSSFSFNSIYDCLTIHKELFSKLYSWAGQLRTINIYKKEKILDGKSIDYVFAEYLKDALEELQNEFSKVNWAELNNKEKIEKICYFVSEFWHIHPFREGNTRTTTMMLYFLIKKADLHINVEFLSKNSIYFRNALVLSSLYSSSKPEYLLGMVSDCVTFKNINSNKYETIDGMEVEKFKYNNHTIEKIETINEVKDWKSKRKK